jgi:hypothetical protein
MLMNEKDAELLDKILQHIKEKRIKGEIASICDILPEIDYAKRTELNAILVKDGYLTRKRINDAKVGGMITEEGIAFINGGGYKSLLKNFSENKKLEALKNENLQLQNENLKLQNKNLKQKWLFFILGALVGIITSIIAVIISKS